jgi:hypothetical protein
MQFAVFLCSFTEVLLPKWVWWMKAVASGWRRFLEKRPPWQSGSRAPALMAGG